MSDANPCPLCGALPCDWVINPFRVSEAVAPIEAAGIIRRIADMAEAVGFQAGVGGSETAGMIVSYLAKHPEQIETVLRDGIFDLPDDWWHHGRLTWQGMNGKVVQPQQARFARIVRKMEKGA